jgi:hypothetical protein
MVTHLSSLFDDGARPGCGYVDQTASTNRTKYTPKRPDKEANVIAVISKDCRASAGIVDSPKELGMAECCVFIAIKYEPEEVRSSRKKFLRRYIKYRGRPKRTGVE